MSAIDYPKPIRDLIVLMKRLPGLGPRSAERLVLWMMGRGQGNASILAKALTEMEDRVGQCAECGFYVELDEECPLCHHTKRDRSLLCVVEAAADVIRLESSRAYTGLYHVLGGKLSPLDNITPADLRIEELRRRVKELEITEVILALGADAEGEVTSNYLADLLREDGVMVSRLAQGMPAGGGLEHVDEMTLYQALSGRRRMN